MLKITHRELKNKYIIAIFLMVIGLTQTQAQLWNYGISGGLNFTPIGATSNDLTGRGLYFINGFISRPYSEYHSNSFLNSIEFMFEPGLNFLSFREVQSDTRYNFNYLDANFSVYFIPEKTSRDLKLFFGIRPSRLLNHNTEIIEFGVYRPLINDPNNKNTNGMIDVALTGGININMGDVVQAELRYVHAFTNNNSFGNINGRPSAVEVGIRLSATDVRNKFTAIEGNMTNQVKRLQRGTLLVMLATLNKKEQQQILNSGTETDLNMQMVALDQANKNIIQAFKTAYSFSKVMYFMDSSAYKVAGGNFNDVFVDENFNVLPTSNLDTANIFIAAFSEDVSAFTQKVDYGLHVFGRNFEALPRPFLAADNYFGVNFGGDPLNYLRKNKYYFQLEDYVKIVKRFNNRMLRISLIKS